jgi:hypothetical protein
MSGSTLAFLHLPEEPTIGASISSAAWITTPSQQLMAIGGKAIYRDEVISHQSI